MRRGTRLIIGTCVLVGGLAASGALAAPASARSYVPADESTVQNLLNATRTVKGLKPLARHDALVAMARGQSDRMADKGDIYHNPRLGEDISSRGVDWRRVGENVGMGPNVALIEQAFLDSPKHYENIVNATYDSIGIGVTKGDDGRMYVTQVFADFAVDPGTAPAPAPASAAPAPKPAAPAPAPAEAPPAAAPVAGAQETPKAAPRPTPVPASPSPNALTGGYVTDEPIAAPDAVRPAASPEGDQTVLEKILDALAFWS